MGLRPGTRWALVSRAKMIFVPEDRTHGAMIIREHLTDVFNYLAYDPTIAPRMPKVVTMDEANYVNENGGYDYLFKLAAAAVDNGCQECFYRLDNHLPFPGGVKQHCARVVRPDLNWRCYSFELDEDCLVDRMEEQWLQEA